MAKNALKEEEFVFPEGGIGDFYMEDDEIEALGRLEAEEAYGSSGIANFPDIAERMASYGRHGDDTVAHVETGELIIPKALIEDNPRLRDSIFSHLEELGVEDPERYVVGSGANSINPDTGLPEFFFKKIFRSIKKTVKKVTKAVKKVVKKVVKVVKKVAPVVLPIALSFTPLGPIYGAALGSGIGTLIKGGNLKDAFKSALIAGGTGALFSGFTGSGTFSENVGQAFADPAGRLSQTLSGAGKTFTGEGLTGQGKLFSQYQAPTTSIDAPTVSEQLKVDAGIQKVSGTETIPEMTGTDFYAQSKAMAEQGLGGAQVSASGNVTVNGVEILPTDTAQSFAARASQQTGTQLTSQVKEPSFFEGIMDKAETAGDYLFRGGESKKALAEAAAGAESTAIQDTISKYGYKTFESAPATVQSAAIEAGKAAAAAAGPGLLATYGPSVALGTAGLAATGFFTAPEQEDLSVDDVAGPSGVDLYEANKDKYGVGGYNIQDAQGPYEVASIYGYNPTTTPYNRNPFGLPQYVADGGEIFPRRNGGIMPDEGIPGQDSVRAMLMPGEFVMTTDAVRGLGNGNLRSGINNMYDMMRGLESRGKAMA
jgi:hypothetical protein